MPPEACCRPLPRLTTPLPHTPLTHRPPDRCAAAVYAWHPRRSPSPAAQAKCDELCLRNGYATTLAALVSALRRLSHLSSASAPLYRCLSAETAGAAWHGIGTSQLTCTSGAVTALLERSACLVASAHAATRRVVGRGGTDAAAASLADDERASREQYWATQRMLDAAEAVARHPDGGAGGAAPTSNLGGRPAGVVDRSATSGGRDGACLLRIEPSGTRISADLNFISQRPMGECRLATLLPLTPLQVTSSHVEGSVLVLVATAGRAAALTGRVPYSHSHGPPSGGAVAFALGGAPPDAGGPAQQPAPPPVPVSEAGVRTVADVSAAASIRPQPGGVGYFAGEGVGGGGGGGDGFVNPDAVDQNEMEIRGRDPKLHRPGNALHEALSYAGRPWCATESELTGRCYFWYHLPEATGGVEMRYRRVGARDWTAHEVAVQVLPGGWWRTGEWPLAGSAAYEHGCWVHNECVMAGIVGPSLSLIGPELPPGTAPPSPHGLGSTGAMLVRIENGRVVGTAADAADTRAAVGESTEERQEVLEHIFHSPSKYGRTYAEAADSGMPPPPATGGGETRGAHDPSGPGTPGLGGRSGVMAAGTPARAARIGGADRSASPSPRRGGGASGVPPMGGVRDVEWSDGGLGTGAIIGRSMGQHAAEEQHDEAARRQRAYQRLWTDDAMDDAERMLVAAGLQIERMRWHGLQYVRIWSMHAPSRGAGGGGFDLPPDAIESLASAATSIHIRVAGGDEGRHLTLKPGVQWPLQQLQRGLPFDRTLHGVDVTPAIARVTWAGDETMLDAMWTKGVSSRGAAVDLGESMRQGRLYAAVGNHKGLFLVAGKRCELPAGQPAKVEVWLGKVHR